MIRIHCEDLLALLNMECRNGDLTVADMQVVEALRKALQDTRTRLGPYGSPQSDKEHYEVRVTNHTPEGCTRSLTMCLDPKNLPSMDSIDLVDGIPQFVQADPFENLVNTVRESVLNITGNPAEVSVRRDDRKQ